jgi:hypothetical protein
LIPLLVSHVHHSARRTGEHLSTLLDSVTLPDVDVQLTYADAHQARGLGRWLDVELHVTQGHGYPDADTSDSLSAVALVLDVITGHEVQGFGSVREGALIDSYGIPEGLALRVQLDVKADPESLPDPRFTLDGREPLAVAA